MPSGVQVSVPRKFRDIEAIADAANLAALQAASPLLLEAVRKEAPRSQERSSEGDSVHLADTLFLEAPRQYGKSKYQVRVRVPEAQKKKFHYIVYGAKGGARIRPRQGQALAFMFPKGDPNPRSKTGKNVYKYVVMAARAPNNFPRRAIRAVAKRLTGLWARQIVVSVNQK